MAKKNGFNISISIVGIFLIVSIGLTSEVYAAEYYVSPNGNNSLDGTTIATAWRTPNKALQEANVDNITSGDIIYLLDGDYPQGTSETPGEFFFDFSLVENKDFGPDWLTFRTYNGTVIYDAEYNFAKIIYFYEYNVSYVKIIGPMDISHANNNAIHLGGISVDNRGNHIYLEGLTVSINGRGGTGIVKAESTANVTLRNFEVYGMGWNGMGLGGGSSTIQGEDLIVEHNYVHSVKQDPRDGTHGNQIQIPGTNETIVRYNYIWNISNSGVYCQFSEKPLHQPCSYAEIYGNYISDPTGDEGIAVKIQEGNLTHPVPYNSIYDNIINGTKQGITLDSDVNLNTSVYNNVIIGTKSTAIWLNGGINATVTSNILIDNEGSDIVIGTSYPVTGAMFRNLINGTYGFTIEASDNVNLTMDNGGKFSIDGASNVTSAILNSGVSIEVFDSPIPTFNVQIKAMINTSTAINGATVELDGVNKTTNSSGVAIFSGISQGGHDLRIYTPEHGDYFGPGRLTPWRNMTTEGYKQTAISNTHGSNATPMIIYFGDSTSTPTGAVTALSLTTISPTNTTYANANIIISGKTNANANISYSLNDADNISIENNTQLFSTWNDSTVEGLNKITIYAINSSNSSSIDSKTTYFTIDTTPPTITITSPEDRAYSTSSIDLDVSADETIDTWWHSLDGGVNVVFVPNTTLTGLSNGLHSLMVYANDTEGNVGFLVVSFTVSVTSSTPPSSGGGGGGGGSTTGVVITKVDSDSSGTAIFDIKDTGFISEITIYSKQTTYYVRLNAETLEKKPFSTMPDPQGLVLSYLKLTKSGISESQLEKADVKFQVPVSWLKDNDIAPDSVFLKRNVLNAWETVETQYLSKDADYAYFSAVTPGFSYFVITGDEGSGYIEEKPVKIEIATPAATTPAPTTPAITTPLPTIPAPAPMPVPLTPRGNIGIILILLIGILAGAYFLKRKAGSNEK